VTVTLIGVGRQATGDALGAPRRRTDQQPGVVVADGCGTHEDRVAVRTDGVDPVEVGIVGQHEKFVGRRCRCSRQSTCRN
jgi:hypothetical protein